MDQQSGNAEIAAALKKLRRVQCDARRDNPAPFPELFLGREAGCVAAASWSIYAIAE
jgi:hypothetical protein